MQRQPKTAHSNHHVSLFTVFPRRGHYLVKTRGSVKLQRRCKCLPSLPARGFYCFTTNLCNFDELATTILLHIHVKTFRLDFQRLAEKFSVAWRKKNSMSETFGEKNKGHKGEDLATGGWRAFESCQDMHLKNNFFLRLFATAPGWTP